MVPKPATETHNYGTRGATNYCMSLPKINKVTYGEYSISYQASKLWNIMVTKYSKENLHLKTKPYCRKFITNRLLESYD